MKTVTIHTSVPYDVLIERGRLSSCGEDAAQVFSPSRQKAAIITDDTVASLYLPIVRASLEQAGFSVCSFAFPHGEDSKCHDTLLQIYDFLIENQITRTDFIVALGGGVVGDISGYAGATYLRGIPFIQIPTTFLAAVDSSVGGKTAVNIPSGKNLIGAFHQPSLVICDPDTFRTLPADTFADGTAEAIKESLIADAELFAFLETGELQQELEQVVARCVEIKREVVEEDERDTGRRMILNFGHTLGHAIEKVTDHQVTHGHAVAMGMILIEQLGEKLGINSSELTSRTAACLKRHGLPHHYSGKVSDLLPACLNDKKRAGELLRLIFVDQPGNALIQSVPVGQLEQLLLSLETGGTE